VRNPYRWQYDSPDYVVTRAAFIDDLASLLRDGSAVKLIGGRGMGKSVSLQLVAARFESDPETRAVVVPGPPDEASVSACVHQLARILRVEVPPFNSMDILMESLAAQGVSRLILLLDEVDQYVLLEGQGNFARLWLNRLETLRKSWRDRFTVLVAGGVGLLHVSHVLGSGLVSRAEERIMLPFRHDELAELCRPLEARGGPLDRVTFELLRNLSGSNPALATYGLGQLWEAGTASPLLLEQAFAEFPERHHDFVRAVHDSVSRRGMVGAPGRVLAVLRAQSGPVPRSVLRDACTGDEPPVDVVQALRVLMAAGLVDVSGMTTSDPVNAGLVPSVLNLPTTARESSDPLEGLVSIVADTLGQIHRFGRDFHDEEGLLQEQIFSSMLAVVLAVVGWKKIKPTREPLQAAGFPDLVVQQQGIQGHVVIETKIWPRNDYTEIQQQVDDYRVSDTIHGIAVMFGDRRVAGWVSDYEQKCLPANAFIGVEAPPDLVGHWRVERQGPDGKLQRTDHFLVQVPKRL